MQFNVFNFLFVRTESLSVYTFGVEHYLYMYKYISD